MVMLFFGIPDEHKEASRIGLLYRYIDQRACSCRCTLNYCVTQTKRIRDPKTGKIYHVLPISTNWRFSSMKQCLDLVEKYQGIRLPRQYFTWFLKISDPELFFQH
jgi:hypothetical protein